MAHIRQILPGFERSRVRGEGSYLVSIEFWHGVFLNNKKDKKTKSLTNL
jgi:hypothetical protein